MIDKIVNSTVGRWSISLLTVAELAFVTGCVCFAGISDLINLSVFTHLNWHRLGGCTCGACQEKQTFSLFVNDFTSSIWLLLGAQNKREQAVEFFIAVAISIRM